VLSNHRSQVSMASKFSSHLSFPSAIFPPRAPVDKIDYFREESSMLGIVDRSKGHHFRFNNLLFCCVLNTVTILFPSETYTCNCFFFLKETANRKVGCRPGKSPRVTSIIFPSTVKWPAEVKVAGMRVLHLI